MSDGNRLPHDRANLVAQWAARAHLAHGLVVGGRHQAESADEDELLPNLGLNLRCEFDADASASQQSGQFVGACVGTLAIGAEQNLASAPFLDDASGAL